MEYMLGSLDERAVFSPGEQSSFLLLVRKTIPLPVIARICNCSERTIRDWQREKFHMSSAAVDLLCTHSGTPPPQFYTKSAYAHTAVAGAKGYRAVIGKYGALQINEALRKRAWKQWWETEGKIKCTSLLKPKPIHAPAKSVELAEFVGIMMGDGGISKYQATVTLHHTDDLKYSMFVARMTQCLFGVKPSIRHRPADSTIRVVISRREAVKFLHAHGLPIGNKINQGLDIPHWIEKQLSYKIACLRGLVDTDGSIFTHRYKVKGKWYAYKRLSFASASPALIRSVYFLFTTIGLHPRITRNGKEVRIDSKKDLEVYFACVGSHNPKHLKRYLN